jgi:xylan 1,4-beta-xylosidase
LRGKNHATGKTGSPLQYIGFHAKGSPELIDGHVRMNMGLQLKDIHRGFEAVNSYPELKNIPIIIGECDPEGCAACSERREPKYAYRNGTMYSSYTAASFARIYELMDHHRVNLEGVVSWSFLFENQEWFAGFRDLATNGVDKPVLNVFRMLGMMRGQRVKVIADNGLKALDIIEHGVRARNDINALASAEERSAWVMVWNYHDDDMEGPPARIELSVHHLNDQITQVHHYRIDGRFSNSFEKWKSMGRPQQLEDGLHRELEQAGQLAMYTSPEWKKTKHESLKLQFELPRQGVSLVQLSW